MACTPYTTSLAQAHADYLWYPAERKFPGDKERFSRMSLIEGSRKVNCVAELHSELVQTTILKDFVDFYGVSKFGNVTNGITPRQWLDQCNSGLNRLIAMTLNADKSVWLKDLTKLEALLEDEDFREDWAAVKQANKEKLAHHMQVTLGLNVNTKAVFNVQIKRLHEYKRQTLNILGVIHVSIIYSIIVDLCAQPVKRYLTLKSMTPEERKTVTPWNVFFAGKAAPGYYITKLELALKIYCPLTSSLPLSRTPSTIHISLPSVLSYRLPLILYPTQSPMHRAIRRLFRRTITPTSTARQYIRLEEAQKTLRRWKSASYDVDRMLGDTEVIELSFPPMRGATPSLTLKAAAVHACDNQDSALFDSLVDSEIA
ncbi:carbohydrate phosphorylase-domain-containing protein [Suillus placidus]|uniref:Alpha-1,4 glucan phosphorylase n=1 Tax=Suillus placidus TaxID=48579 RepID=A0A9P6ZH14_9AGAM|nr:carbohydrate phosphorylase-domain-containing protein [Suillus placidus]